MRAALKVESPVMRRRDSHLVKEGGEDFLEADGSVVRFGRLFVGRTNDLTVAHASTGQEAKVRLGPMIPPSLGIDLGGPSEFSPANHADVPVESAFMQVLDKRGKGMVKQGHVFASPLEVSAMPVPSAEVKGNVTGARLDKPSGEKKISRHLGSPVGPPFGIRFAVPFNAFRILSRQIEASDKAEEESMPKAFSSNLP